MSGAPITEKQRQEILRAVAMGVHPPVACTASGLSRSYFNQLRYRAKNKEPEAVAFLAAIESAEASGEVADVECAQRATLPLDDKPIECPECGAEYRATPEQLAAEVARITDVAKAKGIAADVSLKRLERRHPKRWSLKITHTVQDEHQRLLNVLQRELPAEMFERILDVYLAEDESDQPESASDPVH